ncbi:MAG: MotA/TolQ/ExbB proton channel family protein [Spirochaetaceae bacterium]|jgi:biopolymer transport protein ExbB|nr:MotA/TolQ/ExbB proton channel family protein [Spirochaetaceae bacterium]
METRFFSLMNSGGPINWVILGLYTVNLVLFSGRLVYFFRSRYSRRRFFSAPEQGSPEDSTLSPLRRIREVFLANPGASEAELSEKIDREAAVIKGEMERGLPGLSFITAAAPLLGLLGTITGLMKAFAQMEALGAAADISYLSGGIREAMITTATGLVTALCALGCTRLFENMAALRLKDMAIAVSLLSEKRRAGEREAPFAGEAGGLREDSA